MSLKLKTLAIVMVPGVLAVLFDTTIVAVALRTLARELDTPLATIQWVTTGYLLALGMVIPITGWLLRRIGGKRSWILAMTLFLLGSIGSAFAWSAGSLIGFRILQGAGGGLMLPVMQTLAVQAVGQRGLGKATATIGLPAVLGPVLGPVIGGLIVDSFSWRWIFWVNVPLCLFSLVLAWRLLPSDRPESASAKLDVTGLALLSPGIAAILYGLSEVGVHQGFGHASVVGPIVVGAGLVAAFAVRALSRRAEPLVDLKLFRYRTFSASAVLLFLSGFVLYGAMLVMPLYFQQVRGHDALAAGLLLAPQGLGSLLSRTAAGRLTDKYGPRWFVFGGLIIVALSTVPFALADAGTNEWLLAGALVVRGFGLGGVVIPLIAGSYRGLDPADAPHASILTRTAQQVGGSFGGAVLAVVLARATAASGAVSAYETTFWWTIAFTALAVLVALLLPGRTDDPVVRDEPVPVVVGDSRAEQREAH
ncbi:MDR family MFS transporter [Cryptosporangium phraense]|uniref:Multidrug efflux MFS transporter n=1 Tax=Cryptosporangium phraense TaxID=2593070 RepID=A0A545AMA8_9ACTN|nr:MDR family MFS transporter [Cryptosporangium phraense]TQS42390.1 multidrug efflux MFS transporter [Cryptosporangium phraense]